MAVVLRGTGLTSALSAVGGSVAFNAGTTEPGRVLTVALISRDYDLVLPNITDISYGGEAMTLWSNYDIAVHDYHRIYYLNPPSTTGVQTLSASFDNVASFALMGIGWVGADPLNPLTTAGQANGADKNPTDSLALSRQSALFSALYVSYSSGLRPAVVANSGQVKSTEQALEFDASNNFLGIIARTTGGIGGNPFLDDYTLQFTESWRLQSIVVNERQYGMPMIGSR